jgi:quercetin dioxygenase-like cupin family protein
MTGFPVFTADGDTPWTDAGHGVRRKIVAHAPSLMMVRFLFETGGVGQPHSHPHVQTSLVMSGRFALTIGGETRELGPGDSYMVPSGVVHSALAIEGGELVDAFTPMRDDFLP